MGALLDDLAVLHDQDDVGAADGREPVGDDEAGAVGPQPVHGFLDLDLGAGVDGAGGLVEDEDGRVGEEGPGDGQQLLLAGADVVGFLVDERVVPVGERVDEPVDVGGPGRVEDLLLASLRGCRRRCCRGWCRRTARCPAAPSRSWSGARPAGMLRGVAAVEGDPSAVELVEAHDEVDQRRLAGAGRARRWRWSAPVRPRARATR